MTICIGMRLDTDSSFIMVDSCASSGDDHVNNIGASKVMRVYAADGVPLVVASAGKYRFTQALRHYMWWGDAAFIPGDNVFNEMSLMQHIIPSIKEMMDKYKLRDNDDDPHWMGSNDVLIAIGASVWHITEAFDLLLIRRPFVVVGNGRSTGSGALAALLKVDPCEGPLLTARTAARICAEQLLGVAAPFYAYTTREGDEELHHYPN